MVEPTLARRVGATLDDRLPSPLAHAVGLPVIIPLLVAHDLRHDPTNRAELLDVAARILVPALIVVLLIAAFA